LSIEDDDEIRYFGEDSASRAEDILFLATAENGMFRSLTETPTKCEEAYWMQLLKSGFKWFGGRVRKNIIIILYNNAQPYNYYITPN
jgi:hypothetical protein